MALAPDAGWRSFGVLTVSLAAGNLTAWLAAWAEMAPAALAVAAVLGTAAGALAGGHGRLDATGVLCWDGSAWNWSDEHGSARAIRPHVMLDLGPWMLLRLDGAPPLQCRRVWTVASGPQAAGAWALWRSALAARPAAAADAQGATA